MVTGTAKFVTDNVGQDYRNANHPEAYVINGGTHVLLTFNYRPQGTNDTNRYAKVLDNRLQPRPRAERSGCTVQKQVLIMHKNNDNCDMHQSGEGGGTVVSDAAGSAHITYWAGCNGNGRTTAGSTTSRSRR